MFSQMRLATIYHRPIAIKHNKVGRLPASVKRSVVATSCTTRHPTSWLDKPPSWDN